MTITIDIDERQQKLLDANARIAGMTPEEYATVALLERMEDEQDYRIAEMAYLEWLENPVTYSHDEVMGVLPRSHGAAVAPVALSGRRISHPLHF